MPMPAHLQPHTHMPSAPSVLLACCPMPSPACLRGKQRPRLPTPAPTPTSASPIARAHAPARIPHPPAAHLRCLQSFWGSNEEDNEGNGEEQSMMNDGEKREGGKDDPTEENQDDGKELEMVVVNQTAEQSTDNCAS
ncbi:unnamed protein product [Citrullus colocynthis]|uniref:Uncharacterized protein n=1 Tax=Citrullus colocynthis TaxID=252529 RepID=A0ABP0Y4Z1_9ROSI